MQQVYLRPEQSREAYQHFLGREATESLRSCPKLTPSDFVSVKKAADILGYSADDTKLVRLLTLEAKSRLDANATLYSGGEKSFGFVPRVA